MGNLINKNKNRIIAILNKLLEKRVYTFEVKNINEITIKEVADAFCIPKFLAKLILKIGMWQGDFSLNEDGTYKYLGE